MSSASSQSDAEAGKGFLKKGEKDEKEEKKVISIWDTKFFRLFSVFLYVSFVSGLGLMLSLYHILIWDSTMPPVPNVPGHELY